jgi:DNA-binding phage protein
MAKSGKGVKNPSSRASTERIARDDAVEENYRTRPSPRALYEGGQIDRAACERAEQVRAAGPPERPFRELIAALRAERERQGLSLAELARRTGMDRAAIHKLEIGLNRNPTFATLDRYAHALGARIQWGLQTRDAGEPAKV